MVVLRTALAHPECVASMILIGTAARGVGLLPPAIMEGSARLVRSSGMDALAKILREDSRRNRRAAPAALAAMDAMGFEPWWDRVETKLKSMDPEAFAALGAALSSQESLLPRLAEIACPTTVLVGEQDIPFLESSEELARGIPGAIRITIPAAAHSPQLENRVPWLRAVRDHLVRARSEVSATD
jgi:pimeloyl-ACP methyl ester carboxylesterase